MKNDLLLRIYGECLKDFKACGIQVGQITSVKVNNRLTSVWGRCIKEYGMFRIEIAGRLLDTNTYTEDAMRNTIAHEILHTVEGCFNHGKYWKCVANVLNDRFDYNIKRCTAVTEKLINPENIEIKYRYTLHCKSCNEIVYKNNRKTKVIKEYDTYRCKKCRTDLSLSINC